MNRLWQRLRYLFRRNQLDRDLAEEMRLHLEMKASEYLEAGMVPDEARQTARRQFGNEASLKEVSRETWGWGWVDRLGQDLRYGVRMLAKNPSFTAIAVLTLAVGIGVNTAIFTAYNAVALRPIQALEPSRVVQVGRSTRDEFFSYPDYVYYRDSNHTFSGLIAMSFFGFSMTGAPTPAPATNGGIAGAAGFQFPQVLTGGSEIIGAALVSGNYFKALGVDAVLGRTFLPEEDTVSAPPVALVSHNFWERRFAREPGLLGRSLTLNGIGFTIIGITPRDFLGTAPNVPDLWVPLTAKARLNPDIDLLHDRMAVCCRVYGRLRDGIAQGQAEVQMNALGTRLRQVFPEAGDQARNVPMHFVLHPASPFGPPDEELTAIAALVLAAVSLVLLIACANVASLLLARSAARQKEIAVRLAIGAGRGRLVRQLLTESALISLLAGSSGLVFSWWSLRFLMVQVAASIPTYWGTIAIHVAPDHRVFVYMLLLSVVATAAFGLAPALEASKPNLTSALKEEGAAFSASLRKSRLRDVLVGTQVAVCLVLLIAAGLLARGSQRAFAVDIGFDYRKVISIGVGSPSGMKFAPARVGAMRRRLVERLAGTPEVESVALAWRMPLAGGLRSIAVSLDGRALTDQDAPDAFYNGVSPNYFGTMGIPILRGRNFTSREARDSANFDGSPVIVSEATARKFWRGQDPIGKQLGFGPGRHSIRWAGEEYPRSVSSPVIGVAKDVRSALLDRIDDTCIYLPVAPTSRGEIVMRTQGDQRIVMAALRQELQADSSLELVVQDSQTAFSNQPAFVLSRLGAIGSAIIGILGLLMASVGIYGMVSFAVSQRTHEIGVRMALGARRSDVLLLALRESMRPVVIGLGAGLAGAALVSQIMTSLLFDLSTLDPATFLSVLAFLIGVALLASYVPARRATKVDPMVALRYE